MMNMTQALLPLQVTVVIASLMTLCAQRGYSLEASQQRSQNYQQIATDSLRQAEAHNNKGVELAEQGRVAEAIAAFNRAIKIYPKYEKAHNNLGLALGSQNYFSEAAVQFQQALAINPQNIETHNNLGIALGSQGKFSDAISAFQQAIEIEPNNPTSHQNLGVAFWSEGKKPEAVTSLQKARKLYSVQNNTDGINHIEQILQQIKLPEQGLESRE